MVGGVVRRCEGEGEGEDCGPAASSTTPVDRGVLGGGRASAFSTSHLLRISSKKLTERTSKRPRRHEG